jgi:hypothetical protein
VTIVLQGGTTWKLCQLHVQIVMQVSTKPRQGKFYVFHAWLANHRRARVCKTVQRVKKEGIEVVAIMPVIHVNTLHVNKLFLFKNLAPKIDKIIK